MINKDFNTFKELKAAPFAALNESFTDRWDLYFPDMLPLYYWDKRFSYKHLNGVDLKDLLNGYRVYRLEDISKILPIDTSEYTQARSRAQNILRSYSKVGVSTGPYATMELIPRRWIKEWYLSETKLLREICFHLSEKSWFKQASKFFTARAAHTDVLTKLSYDLNTTEGRFPVRLDYGANFRFKSLPGGLNLLNMPKSSRHKIIPQEDDSFIFYADYRQFEFRSFCHLHPDLEVDFGSNDLYGELGKRFDLVDPKIQLIAYGYGQKNEKLDKVLNRDKLLGLIDGDCALHDDVPIIIREDDPDHIRIHSLVQTYSQYVYLKRLKQVLTLLEDYQSMFMYPIHDCMIFSIRQDEAHLMEKIQKILEDKTYKVKCKKGPNLAELENV